MELLFASQYGFFLLRAQTMKEVDGDRYFNIQIYINSCDRLQEQILIHSANLRGNMCLFLPTSYPTLILFLLLYFFIQSNY